MIDGDEALLGKMLGEKTKSNLLVCDCSTAVGDAIFFDCVKPTIIASSLICVPV